MKDSKNKLGVSIDRTERKGSQAFYHVSVSGGKYRLVVMEMFAHSRNCKKEIVELGCFRQADYFSRNSSLASINCNVNDPTYHCFWPDEKPIDTVCRKAEQQALALVIELVPEETEGELSEEASRASSDYMVKNVNYLNYYLMSGKTLVGMSVDTYVEASATGDLNYSSLPKHVQSDESALLRFAERDGYYLLKWMKKSGINPSASVCARAVVQNGCSIELVPEDVLTEDMVIDAVTKHNKAAELVPDRWLTPRVMGVAERKVTELKERALDLGKFAVEQMGNDQKQFNRALTEMRMVAKHVSYMVSLINRCKNK